MDRDEPTRSDLPGGAPPSGERTQIAPEVPSATAKPARASESHVGRYEIIGPLATGGMAEILLARLVGPSRFERPVVIKRILPQLARDPSFVAMFLDEARIAARIRHPNVVQVTELGDTDGELYLVMEYLEGESLAGLLRRLAARDMRLPPTLAAHVIAESCAGLHAAHELTDTAGAPLGVIHRDISPQNVFVGYDGTIKVLDFGIAKAADRVTHTEAGQLKGKVEYMSPEQVAGRALDRRSDVFALGVVLYEVATARRLFRRDNKLQAMKAVSDADIPAPSALVSGFPGALETIITRALARHRDQRFSTASEMRRELTTFVRTADPALAPDEALSALMCELFADRIGEKRAMMRSFRTGDQVVQVPVAEVDVQVELASALDSAPTGEPSDARSRRPPTARGPWSRVIAAIAVAALVGPLAWVLGQQSLVAPSSETTRTPTAPIATAPEEASTAAPSPATPALVHVVVESDPPGASVRLAGAPSGITPVTLEIARATDGRTLTLELPAHEPASMELVPDADQRVRLVLRPSRGASTRRRPARPSADDPDTAATPSEDPDPDSVFRRFD